GSVLLPCDFAPASPPPSLPPQLCYDPQSKEAPMTRPSRRAVLALILAAPAACGRPAPQPDLPPGATPQMRALIDKWARHYDAPPALVHRVVQRESGYNPRARNGPYYGLMQILPQTAATMGHRGPPSSLLDADTNLQFGVKYL